MTMAQRVRQLYQPVLRPPHRLAQRVGAHTYVLASGMNQSRALMGVGTDGANLRGYSGGIGYLMPDRINGVEILYLVTDVSSNVIALAMVDNAQIGSAGWVDLYMPGLDMLRLPWTGSQYVASSAPHSGLFDTFTGGTLQIGIQVP